MKKIIAFVSFCLFITPQIFAQTIATGSITTPICAGASISVPYTITGTFTAGNIFTAQLSSATGSFTTPVNIGSLAAVASGTITAMIPPTTAAGNAYRIRVVSNTPVITGTQNAAAITINAIAANPAVSISANLSVSNLCANSSITFTASLTNGGTSPVYQWYKNNFAVGTSSASYTNNLWNTGDTVWCKITGSLSCALISGASSNYIVIGTENTTNNVWRQKADLGFAQSNAISARTGAVAFSIGQKGYAGLGYTGLKTPKDFWEFDPTTNTWTQKANFGGNYSQNGVGFSIGSKGYVGTGSSTLDFWEFDPIANTWTAKANFPGTARTKAVGFSIGNKGYLGTGLSGTTKLSDFWEYDPSLNTWVQKANFGGGLRYSAVGFSIGNKGYIGTGTDGAAYKNDFWEFDPSKNSWTQKANFGGVVRCNAVGFSIGNVGFLGTGLNNAYLNDFWKYNPINNTWLQIINIETSGRDQAFSFSIGNKGYVGSGYLSSNTSNYLSSILSFDTTQNTWSNVSTLNGNARAEAVSFSIGNYGYLGTGFDGVNYKSDFWQYDPLNNTWSQKADLSGGARKGAVGFAIGNKGYVGTGRNGSADFYDFWQYNPTTNSWVQKNSFPNFARSGAVGFVVGSKGYIGTGYRLTNTTYCRDFWAYDTLTQSWTAQSDFPGLARSEAVAFTLSNKAYVGTGFAGYALDDFWEFNPSTNSWAKKSTFAKASRYNAVAFSIGAKGYLTTGYYAEGINSNGNQIFYKDNWEYDATLNSWSQLPSLASERYEATAFAIGNVSYIGTGKGVQSLTPFYRSDLWEFSPSVPNVSISTTQTSINSVDSCTTSSLLFSAKAHDYVVSPSYQWYKNNTAVATGINYSYSPVVYGDSIKCTMNSTTTCSVNASLISNVIAIDNFANNSSVISNWKQIPDMGFNQVNGPKPRYGAVGFSIGNYGYIGTGMVDFGALANGAPIKYLDDFWQYDPTSNTWSQKSNFPGGVRGYAISFVVGQKGYVGTGTNGVYSKNDLWEYDPSTNQWLPKSNLPASPRKGAIAFTIDGLGYVGTGNTTINGTSKDFWQYNPNSDSWLQKANFAGGDVDFAAAFSIGSIGYATGSLGDFWAYNPTTNLWTSKAGLTGTAVTKALGFSVSGKGYICFGGYVDGIGDKYSTSNVREYDPLLNTWTSSFNNLFPINYSRESAVGFTIGTNTYFGTGLLYENYQNGGVGTMTQSYNVFNDLWKFNPTSASSTDRFVELAKMGGRGRGGACSFTIKDKGYVIGGFSEYYTQNYKSTYKDVWQFDPLINSWTQKANFPGTTTNSGIGFSAMDKGYYGLGGSNTDFWEYDPQTNNWVKKANFPGVARTSAISFSIGPKGYIGTGSLLTSNSYLNDFWEYNPSSNSWLQLANFGGVARRNAAGFSLNGKGYIGVGSTSTGVLNDFWEYNPSTNAWVQKANFGGAARYEATGFAVGGKGYIGSGYNLNTYSDFWAYQPETNVWTAMETVPFEIRKRAISFVAGEKAYVGTGIGYYNDLSDFWEFNPNSIRLKIKPIDTVYCAGNTFQLSYTVGCISPKNGNVFTAQLSDSLGSFQNPTSIGTVSSTGLGTISANLSSNVASGSGYRIRIASSNPVFISTDNGQNIQIKKAVGEKLNVSNCSYFVWRGDTLRQSGTFYKLNSLLCNATDTLNLTILPSFRDTTNVFICTDQFPYSWRGQQYQQYGIYSVTFTNQYNCDSIYYLKLSPGNQCQANLTILGFLEGFTASNGQMTPTLYNLGISSDPTATDTIQIELWSPNALSSTLPTYTTKTVLKSNGTAFTPLPTNIAGQVFYIAIKHRNSIEVWSAHPILFSGNVVYDFKSSVDSAYTDGFNPPLRNIGMGKNALFSGDVNQDGTIDIFDTQLIENEASAFQFGYNPGDVNGDMSSDIFDLQVVENNSVLFIYKARPF